MAKQNKYCIYMHENKINNKKYIGQTCNIKIRWHAISYKGSSRFYNAIQKYGWENFNHIILEDNLTAEEADLKEKYYIKKYNTTDQNFGYNLKDGGTNGYHHSKETLNKIKEGNKKYAKINKQKLLIQLEKACQKTRKSVICINTGEVFISQVLAAKYAGLNNSTPISRCCNGERKTAGKHPITKERLKWKFYDG